MRPAKIKSTPELMRLSGEIARQSQMIGYINAFTLYTILAFSVIPLIMLVRMPKEEAPGAAELRGHIYSGAQSPVSCNLRSNPHSCDPVN